MRVELTDGAWVDLKDVDSINNKDRFAYKRLFAATLDALRAADNLAGSSVLTVELSRVVVAPLILGWSHELPLPSEDPDVWEDDRFPFADYDLIQAACAPHVAALRGVNFEPQKSEVKGRPDPETPTETFND